MLYSVSVFESHGDVSLSILSSKRENYQGVSRLSGHPWRRTLSCVSVFKSRGSVSLLVCWAYPDGSVFESRESVSLLVCWEYPEFEMGKF